MLISCTAVTLCLSASDCDGSKNRCHLYSFVIYWVWHAKNLIPTGITRTPTVAPYFNGWWEVRLFSEFENCLSLLTLALELRHTLAAHKLCRDSCPQVGTIDIVAAWVAVCDWELVVVWCPSASRISSESTLRRYKQFAFFERLWAGETMLWAMLDISVTVHLSWSVDAITSMLTLSRCDPIGLLMAPCAFWSWQLQVEKTAQIHRASYRKMRKRRT